MDKTFLQGKIVKVQSDNDFIADEQKPCIKEGEYEVRNTGFEEGIYKCFPKLYLHFEIINDEKHRNTKLDMMINLTDTKTKKRFTKIPKGSKYYEQWVVANHGKPPSAGQKMPFKIFENGMFVAVVRNVKPKFKDNTNKSENLDYSIIDYLKKRLN